MTSWTLDNTTFHYWTLSETGKIVWGYPKHGDEVIIDDRFKYIFKTRNIQSGGLLEEISKHTTGFYHTLTETRLKEIINENLNMISESTGIVTTSSSGGFHVDQEWMSQLATLNRGVITLQGTLSQESGEQPILSNTRVSVEVYQEENTSNDEISAYMREAQQMMNNGR